MVLLPALLFCLHVHQITTSCSLKFHDFFTHALNIFLLSLAYGFFQIALHTPVVLPSLFVVDILPLPSVIVPLKFLSRFYEIHSGSPRHLSCKENRCYVASGKLNYANSLGIHNIYIYIYIYIYILKAVSLVHFIASLILKRAG